DLGQRQAAFFPHGARIMAKTSSPTLPSGTINGPWPCKLTGGHGLCAPQGPIPNRDQRDLPSCCAKSWRGKALRCRERGELRSRRRGCEPVPCQARKPDPPFELHG